MTIFEELQARGLIAQITDEQKVRNLVNNGEATFYIGFDPTADSLRRPLGPYGYAPYDDKGDHRSQY